MSDLADFVTWLDEMERMLWEKRDDPYFLGKHDGINSALFRARQIAGDERERASTGDES